MFKKIIFPELEFLIFILKLGIFIIVDVLEFRVHFVFNQNKIAKICLTSTFNVYTVLGNLYIYNYRLMTLSTVCNMYVYTSPFASFYIGTYLYTLSKPHSGIQLFFF